MRAVGRTREEFVNHEPQASDHDLRIFRVFYQHFKWFIETIETFGLLLLHSNSGDARFFHGFGGTINHS